MGCGAEGEREVVESEWKHRAVRELSTTVYNLLLRDGNE